MKTIHGAELKQTLDSHADIVLLEALPLPYYRQGHLPGALPLPLDKLDQKAREAAPDPLIRFTRRHQRFTRRSIEQSRKERRLPVVPSHGGAR